MSVDTTKDPIHQTFQAIWDCLEAETTFTDNVESMNRIKYTGTSRTVDKSGLRTADMPQVRVIQSGLDWGIGNTSNSSILRVWYDIEVKVGDKRLEELTKIQWAIYLAMSRWETYMEAEIEWADLNPFKKVIPKKVDTQYAPKAEPPEPAGWRSVWNGGAELWFTTTDLETGEE